MYKKKQFKSGMRIRIDPLIFSQPDPNQLLFSIDLDPASDPNPTCNNEKLTNSSLKWWFIRSNFMPEPYPDPDPDPREKMLDPHPCYKSMITIYSLCTVQSLFCLNTIFEIKTVFLSFQTTVYIKSLDPIYIVAYYTKLVKTSWTYSTQLLSYLETLQSCGQIILKKERYKLY